MASDRERICAERLGKTMFNKIGGQAVIEGVMMRAPGRVATAVRRPDGTITVRARDYRSVVERFPFLRLPVLRGAVALFESLALGVGALMFSAEEAAEEEEKKGDASAGKEPAEGKGKKGGGGFSFALYGTLALSLLLGLAFFFYLPLMLTEWIGVKGGFLFNLIDGAIRLLFLFFYIFAISRWKEMRRVLAYHGAEHKSIFNLESGTELSVANAQRFTTLHPRCGTSFLLIVALTSVFVFLFLGRPESIGERFVRLAFVPVIAGLSYEVLKLTGRWADRPWMAPLVKPGLFLQTMTTVEPEDDQVEVGLAALRAALGERLERREELFHDVG
ncbi:MAG: DUF1385 domain-containing protein [Candidatus Eisenbacteria bacterium]|nr:DUF1385 domain-containing protein [Candidatus Eisenbacteria bacterium]